MTTTFSTPERRVVNVEDISRSVQSASRTRNVSSPSRPNAQLTIESVLQSVNGDTKSALEMVINDRNVLSAQNIQLWKLVEKQRQVHSTVSKELERVRAERDKALARLDSERDDRKTKTTAASSSAFTLSRSESSSPLPETPNGRHTPGSQYRPEIGESSRSSNPSGTLSSSRSRSHEPMRSHSEGHTLQVPNIDTDKPPAVKFTPSLPRSHSPNPNATSPSVLSEASSPVKRQDQSHSQKQSDSSFNPSTTGTSNPLLPVANSETSPLSTLTIPHLRDRTPARESRITLPDEARRYIATLQESPVNPSSSQQIAPTMTAEEPLLIHDDTSTAPALSIPHTDDISTSGSEQTVRRSPPRVDHRSGKRTSSEERKGSLPPSKAVPERQGTLTPPLASPPYGTTPSVTPRSQDRDRASQPLKQATRPVPASVSREVNASLNTNTTNPINNIPPISKSAAAQDTSSDMPKSNNVPDASTINITRERVKAQRLAFAEAQSQAQATLPQHSLHRMHAQAQTQAQAQAQAQANYQERIRAGYDPLHTSPQRNGPPDGITFERVAEYNNQDISTTRQAKRMYLVEADLRRCKISVVGSHIRPNDRGKEVLSFSIEVSLSDTESLWKVEKLYSDVLALDTRIRSRLSRGDAKKLPHLPDSKLFRDNAPAKVDQRKAALESYLQNVVQAATREADEICDFFSTDLINEANGPVTQMGYKEGYLTKRGKNFGGWKTRYFVLQGPSLEYFESRGGNHLGSINITGAQVGRQQRRGGQSHSDDENEYRHAILILEQKKGPPASQQRHVLCAESDQERDSWVNVLIRYISGTYNGQTSPPPGALIPSANANTLIASQPRPSTSSVTSADSTVISPVRRHPANTIAHDQSKHLQAASGPDSASTSPMEHQPPQHWPDQAIASDNVPISSSLPSQLNTTGGGILAERATSELGYYPDLGGIRQHYQEPQKTPNRHDRQQARVSVHPAYLPSYHNQNSSVVFADVPATATEPHSSKVKISGPINGTPIFAGHKFRTKDGAESGNERERKSKSKNFWTGIMRSHNNTNNHNNNSYVNRIVFGVPVSEALEVAQIASLPAVAFRCIQYLEAKKAHQEEGIYRLSGSSAVIKSLRDQFNLEGDVDLLASSEEWDFNAVAGLLKSFLREIPGGLFTRELQPRFTAVVDLADPDERVDELSQLVSQLPESNYSLLRALIAHLILIIQNSSINRMTTRNIGIVFCPTLAIPAAVFNLMLTEFNRVFNVDGDTGEETEEAGADTAAAGDSDARMSKRISVQNNRNSRSYADGAADQILGLGGRALEPGEEESDSADEVTLPDSFSDLGSETQDPDATAQFSRSNLEISQQELVETEVEETTDKDSAAEKIPVIRTRKHKETASRDLRVNVRQSTVNYAGLPSPPPLHPSRGYH